MIEQSKWTTHQVEAYEFMKKNPNLRMPPGMWKAWGINSSVVLALWAKEVVSCEAIDGDPYGRVACGLKNE